MMETKQKPIKDVKADFELRTYLGFIVIRLLTDKARSVAQSMDYPNCVVRTRCDVTFNINAGTEERCQMHWELFQKTCNKMIKSGLRIA